jgi:hypothetical protein
MVRDVPPPPDEVESIFSAANTVPMTSTMPVNILQDFVFVECEVVQSGFEDTHVREESQCAWVDGMGEEMEQTKNLLVESKVVILLLHIGLVSLFQILGQNNVTVLSHGMHTSFLTNGLNLGS